MGGGLVRTAVLVWLCAGVSVWMGVCVGADEGADKKVKLMDKAAQIEMSILDASGAIVNTSFGFGLFGKDSLLGPASGQLVHVRSEGDVNHGCGDYNHDLPSSGDWVALVERGSCTFNTKIRVATRQYNASAVIIYDNRPTGSLLTMMQVSMDDEVYVFVTQAFGRRLALLVDGGVDVRVNISFPSFSTSSSLSSSSSFLHTLFLLSTCFVASLGRF